MPDGWEIIRIGTPRPGEHWIGYADSRGTLEPIKQEYDCGSSRFDMAVAVVQRKAYWQKLWPHQWREAPLQGRFRSHVDSPWEYGTIVQYRPGQMKWRAHDGRWFKTAEVRSMDIPQCH